MSNKDQQPDKSGFSLQGEIKKRKTQEIQRTIEQKKIDVARGGSSAVGDPPRASQTMTPATPPAADPRRSTQTNAAVPDPKRATQSARAVPTDPRRTSQTMQSPRPTVDPRRVSQAMPAIAPKRVNRTALIAVGAGTLAIVVLIGTFLIAGNVNTNTVQPTATLAALPMVSADDILSYLQKADVPLSDIRQLPVDHTVWSADQEIQFDIQRGGNKGTFIILSYSSNNRAVGESFQAKVKANLKDWQVSPLSNILLLTSPDTAPDITTEMASHLTSYMLAPYRPYLFTATPQPTPTEQVIATATAH